MALASVAAPGTPGNNIIEEVAWMVGDQPIYKSEIEEAYQQMLYEKTPVNGDPYCVVPEQLAIEKLFLHQADMDTVEVQESMVSMAVDQRLNYLITNLGSKEKVEEYFRKPISEFRSQLSDVMRNQYRVQQVQASLTKDLKVTPSDVRRYFSTLPQDSIPFVPLQVECEIITINPKIPQEEIDDIKSRLRQYADRINKGEGISRPSPSFTARIPAQVCEAVKSASWAVATSNRNTPPWPSTSMTPARSPRLWRPSMATISYSSSRSAATGSTPATYCCAPKSPTRS